MFRKVVPALVCAVPLALAAPACAEEELAPGFNACMDRSGGVTANMIECMNDAHDYLDKRLNQVYKKARTECEDDACRKKLLEAERAWIKYRDAMSDAVWAMNGGGSMSRLMANQFILEETKKQTKWLGGEDR